MTTMMRTADECTVDELKALLTARHHPSSWTSGTARSSRRGESRRLVRCPRSTCRILRYSKKAAATSIEILWSPPFDKLAAILPSDTLIVAMCAKGGTSVDVAAGLRDLQYPAVTLAGGMREWGDFQAFALSPTRRHAASSRSRCQHAAVSATSSRVARAESLRHQPLMRNHR
jgi:hypothetical protein